MKISIDQERCIGCGMCESMCDECFEMDGDKAKVLNENGCDSCDVKEVAANCPAGAIKAEV